MWCVRDSVLTPLTLPLPLPTGVASCCCTLVLHVAVATTAAVALQSTAFTLGRAKLTPFRLRFPLACQLPSTSHLCGISGTMAVTMVGRPPCTRSCLLATFRFPSWLNRFTTHLPPFPYHSQFHVPSPPPTTTTTIPTNVATLGLCCNCLLFPNSLHFSICFFRSAESQVGSVNSWDFTVYLTGFTFFPPGLHCSSPFSFRYRHPSLSLPLSCFSVAQFAMHSS